MRSFIGYLFPILITHCIPHAYSWTSYSVSWLVHMSCKSAIYHWWSLNFISTVDISLYINKVYHSRVTKSIGYSYIVQDLPQYAVAHLWSLLHNFIYFTVHYTIKKVPVTCRTGCQSQANKDPISMGLFLLMSCKIVTVMEFHTAKTLNYVFLVSVQILFFFYLQYR